jgi:tetratricopeptide (TPR) repeat protein
MSLDVMTWMLALALIVPPQTAPDRCAAEARRVLAEMAAATARGDVVDTVRLAAAGDTADSDCAELRLASWSWHGWSAAVTAADRGGTPESLAPVRAAIDAAAALGPPRSAAAYAAALLRAAAAAAQDERDEMLVWIDEARAISTRLALSGPAPAVPLAIDRAEGELWHGVDDHELAEAAFTRALAVADTPAAWRGLARARDRRGNRAGACEAYRRAATGLAREAAPGPLATEARGYLLLCTP